MSGKRNEDLRQHDFNGLMKTQNPLEASEYARLTGLDGKWRETWWRKDFLEFIANRCELGRVERMLDVGCGAGHWSRALSQVLPSSLLIAGIDIEQKFVDRSMELGAAFGLSNTDYKLGSGELIPYGDSSFDLVTCQTVLIHVRDPSTVLKEMQRVLKPGGTLLLAEPNNLVGYFNMLLAEPRPEWPLIHILLDFYQTCLQGKKELGMGDSSVGERLPNLVAQMGFEQVRVAVNENCPALVPPYSTEEQKIECEFLKNCITSDAWLGFGPRQNALRFYKAGGGRDADFDNLWSQAMLNQKNILAALESKTYSGSRGVLMYLISAKKAG
ncbi:MAG: hypothetical protein C5B58_14145 [Acidobacteria bacterium]|nr:MAG: hypothetical protein C5B58_14145 [Acidobacteriota bacterium]